MIKLNLSRSELIKEAIKNEECDFTEAGALVTKSGKHTGRSPKGKAIVFDKISEHKVDWKNNSMITEANFNLYCKHYLKRLTGDYYGQDVIAGAGEGSVKVRIITELAWHSLFVRNMFKTVDDPKFVPDYTVYNFPSNSDTPKVIISLEKKIILISGTKYAGETKKSVFTVLNFLYPQQHFLPMHCSVNTDLNGENAAIFFGLSGTGKTTLSSDINRLLIGDDEHGWTSQGLCNFEGGCYAKTIRLSQDDEPQIYDACHRFGTILENVIIKNGHPDFNDNSITENTRASYPIEFIQNHSTNDTCGHPKNIIMLTCDAFGVLPAVSKLSPKEAVKQFVLGYTAKVAGTEVGITEPVATFSYCFGSPFMPCPPNVYAEILEQQIKAHNVNCWLVNTGWTGGQYGEGHRISIKDTRSIIDDILNGSLKDCNTKIHEYTGLTVPVSENLSDNILFPELGWKDKKAYKKKVKYLMSQFIKLSAYYGV